MRIRRHRTTRRRGTTSVEMAFIMMPILLMFFGVFEYGRFYMDRNILNNAAREGCRWALANNTSNSLDATVSSTVTNYMAGRSSDFSGSTITVTVKGTSVSTGTTYNDGTTANACNALQAGDWITVTVTGNYIFMSPTKLLGLPSTVTMTSTCTMIVEGAS